MKHRAIGKSAALAPIFVLLAACYSPPVVDRASIAEETKTRVAMIVEAFNARDADKATSFNAPDIVQMFHGQSNLVGREDDLEKTREQLADPAVKLTISDEQVDLSEAGDLVLYTTSYSYDFTDPSTKQVVTEAGNWVLIFKRQSDGTMKIYREIISDTPAA